MNKKDKKFYENGIRVVTDLKEIGQILAQPGFIESLSKQLKAAEKAKKRRKKNQD